MRRVGLILVYALAIVVAVIAIRIETLNAAAGYYLPRTNPNDNGKWRESQTTEKFWRHFHTQRDANGEPIRRDLTPAEQAKMTVDLAQAKANNRLRAWVSTAGLVQYLLLPALVIASLITLAAKPTGRRFVSLLPVFAIVVLAAGSLWYRQYFPSLDG